MLPLSLHRKIHFFLLSVGLAYLPFIMIQKSGFRISGLLSILIMVNVLFALRHFKNAKLPWRHPFLLAVFSFIVFYILLLPFSAEIPKAINALLLLLNVLFGTLAIALFAINKEKITQLMLSFIAGLLVSSLYIFREGIEVFITEGLDKDCLFCVVELLIPMHRPYYGLLMTIAIFWLIQQLFHSQWKWLMKLLFSLLIIYLGLYTLLMFPKVALFASAFGIAFLLLKIENKKLKVGLLMFSLLSASAYILIAPNSLSNNPLDGYSNQFGASMESRKAIWKAAWQSLSNSPKTFIIGTGLSSEQTEILKHTDELSPIFKQQKYNTHNQYLSFWMQMGLVGLVLSFSFIMLPLYHLKKEDGFGIFICVIFAFCWLTENMLNREAGVLSYAFLFLPIIGSYLQTNQKT